MHDRSVQQLVIAVLDRVRAAQGDLSHAINFNMENRVPQVSKVWET